MTAQGMAGGIIVGFGHSERQDDGDNTVSAGLNVYDILKYDHLVLLESSIQGIEKRLVP